MVRSIFKSIEREKISVKIAKQIKSLIIQNKLRPGEALAPERELAKLLQVSRPPLRSISKPKQGIGSRVLIYWDVM